MPAHHHRFGAAVQAAAKGALAAGRVGLPWNVQPTSSSTVATHARTASSST
ncbi:hypothetical protein [Actinomadura sp. NPDC048394]|uniref:hypothetical protein n=1 Tax=Actinomadura sp. NPDC048394 TaxID=3158223 RepID=UPI0033E7E7CC